MSAVFSQGGRTPLYIAARGSFTTIVDMIIKTARLDYPTVRTETSHPDLVSSTTTTSTGPLLHDSPPKAQPAPILTISAAAHHVSTTATSHFLSLSLCVSQTSRCIPSFYPTKFKNVVLFGLYIQSFNLFISISGS